MKKLYHGVPGYDLDHEYNIILKEIEDGKILANSQSGVSVLDCFRGANLRRTIVSLVPFNNQLWDGAPVLFVYTSYFFQQAGVAQPFIATVAVNTVFITFVAISFYTTDRVGRRPLLVYVGAFMVPLLFIIGGILKMPLTTANSTAMIAVSCIWVAAYSSSAGPLGFTFLADCSTSVLRAKTANMGSLAFALMSLVTTYCTPLMLAAPNFGVSNTMFFYGTTSAIFVVVMWFVIPETKNRSYVELDEMFELKVPTHEFGSFETSVDKARKAAKPVNGNQDVCRSSSVCGDLWCPLYESRAVWEIIGVLKIFGLLTGISELLLSLTVFAFRNCLGDLVTNLAMAKLGYPIIAMSACLGCPLFNVPVSIGLGGLIVLVLSGERDLKVPLGDSFMITALSLMLMLVGLLVFVPNNGWVIGRKTGFMLFVFWVVCTGFSVVVEYMELSLF